MFLNLQDPFIWLAGRHPRQTGGTPTKLFPEGAITVSSATFPMGMGGGGHFVHDRRAMGGIIVFIKKGIQAIYQ